MCLKLFILEQFSLVCCAWAALWIMWYWSSWHRQNTTWDIADCASNAMHIKYFICPLFSIAIRHLTQNKVYVMKTNLDSISISDIYHFNEGPPPPKIFSISFYFLVPLISLISWGMIWFQCLIAYTSYIWVWALDRASSQLDNSYWSSSVKQDLD